MIGEGVKLALSPPRGARVSSTPTAPPSRWRYLRDGDVLHAAAITLLAVICSGGLVWLAYLIRVWRVAATSPVQTPACMTTLVFGCQIIGDQPSPEFQRRLQRALTLARSHCTDHILLLGGCSGGPLSEAAAGAAWLRRQGLPDDVRLELEQDSIDSLENLRHARVLLQASATLLPSVALVTSRYHLARCLMLAHRLGLDGLPVAAEPSLSRHPRYLGRLVLESGYVMCMDLGLRWAQLLGLQRMVDRIS
jgi:vancomycin permeability regulator SanA